MSVLVLGLCPFGFQFGAFLILLDHLFCQLLNLGRRLEQFVKLLHLVPQEVEPVSLGPAIFVQGAQAFPKQIAQNGPRRRVEVAGPKNRSEKRSAG